MWRDIILMFSCINIIKTHGEEEETTRIIQINKADRIMTNMADRIIIKIPMADHIIIKIPMVDHIMTKITMEDRITTNMEDRIIISMADRIMTNMADLAITHTIRIPEHFRRS